MWEESQARETPNTRPIIILGLHGTHTIEISDNLTHWPNLGAGRHTPLPYINGGNFYALQMGCNRIRAREARPSERGTNPNQGPRKKAGRVLSPCQQRGLTQKKNWDGMPLVVSLAIHHTYRRAQKTCRLFVLT